MLLMAHAEALLLIHDEKPQFFERHVLLQQPVGADHNIALTAFKLRQRFFHLGAAGEPGQTSDFDGKAEKPADRRLCVLLGQHRGRHQDRGLIAVQHALHDSPQGHLCLPVAHVAAQQPVHGYGPFHIGLDLPHTAQLVVRFRILEGVLEFRLPRGVRREGVALAVLPRRVQADELPRHFLCRGLCPGAGARPIRPAQLRKLHGRVLAGADVFRYQIELRGRDIQAVRPRVADLDVIPLRAVHRHFENAREPADAVRLVHHEIAHGKILVRTEPRAGRQRAFPPRRTHAGAHELRIRKHRQPDLRIFHARGQPAHGDGAPAGLRQLIQPRGKAHAADLPAGKHLLQRLGPPPVRSQQHAAIALPQPVAHIVRRGLRAAGIGGQLLCRYADGGARLHGIAAYREGVRHHHGVIRQLFHRGLPRKIEFRQPAQQRAALDEEPDILCRLLQIPLCPFGAFPGLIHNHQRVRRQVIQRRGKRRVYDAHIPVRRGKFPGVFQRLDILFQRLPHFFRVEPGGVQVDPRGKRPQRGDQRGAPAFHQGGQRFRPGQYAELPDLLRAALAGNVESVDGVDLIAEEIEP